MTSMFEILARMSIYVDMVKVSSRDGYEFLIRDSDKRVCFRGLICGIYEGKQCVKDVSPTNDSY